MSALIANVNLWGVGTFHVVPSRPGFRGRLLGTALMAGALPGDLTIEQELGPDVIGPLQMFSGVPLILPVAPEPPGNDADHDYYVISESNAAIDFTLTAKLQVTGVVIYDYIWDGVQSTP